MPSLDHHRPDSARSSGSVASAGGVVVTSTQATERTFHHCLGVELLHSHLTNVMANISFQSRAYHPHVEGPDHFGALPEGKEVGLDRIEADSLRDPTGKGR